MKSHKMYKWVRGILTASAFTSVMFIMQACYGTPEGRMNEVTMSGTIIDKATSQPLSGISVTCGSSYSGDYSFSDENGQFTLTFLISREYYERGYFDLEFADTLDRYQTLDTVVESSSKLEISLVAK